MGSQTALAALTLLDGNFGQQWYAVQIPSAADGDHLVCAAYCEASSTAHFYAVTTEEAGVVVASSTTDIAAELAALGLNKTAVQYCSSSPYAFASAIARILAVDYTGKNTTLTLMWKQEPGVVPESLTASQIASLEAKNCNVFVNYNNGTAIFEPGKCVSGEFIDTIMGIDAFKVTLQTALYNVLYTLGTKAPQTDDGVHLLVAAAEKVCTQFVNNGLFAPGTWNYAGFGALLQGAYLDKGYYVYAAPVASQSSADRAARKSPTIQIAVLMAGAIHTVALSVQVSN